MGNSRIAIYMQIPIRATVFVLLTLSASLYATPDQVTLHRPSGQTWTNGTSYFVTGSSYGAFNQHQSWGFIFDPSKPAQSVNLQYVGRKPANPGTVFTAVEDSSDGFSGTYEYGKVESTSAIALPASMASADCTASGGNMTATFRSTGSRDLDTLYYKSVASGSTCDPTGGSTIAGGSGIDNIQVNDTTGHRICAWADTADGSSEYWTMQRNLAQYCDCTAGGVCTVGTGP